MERENHSKRWQIFCYLLVGLETGVLGGLLVLAWFALNSMWQGQSVWAVPVWLGSTVYGNSVFRSAFQRVALTGIALQLSTAGIVGALFGLVVREAGNLPRVVLLGLLTGLGWYYVGRMTLWAMWTPAASLQASQESMFVAHLLFGAFLARYPRFLRSARDNAFLGR